MSEQLIVYGASDDLIETAGLLSEELNPPYGKPAVLTVMVDDATYTSLHIEYDPDGTGEWRIQPTSLGSLVTVFPALGEGDGQSNPLLDDHGCPPYSDKAVIDMRGIEGRRVNLRLTSGDAGRET